MHQVQSDVIDNNKKIHKKGLYTAQIRYRGEHHEIQITQYSPKEKTAQVTFTSKAPTITPGQSLVIYHDRQCYGGGIVQ